MRPSNQEMLDLIEQFPIWLTNPILDSRLKEGGKFKKVVFCGMGGSAIAALVIKDIFAEQLKLPFEVVQDYKLPKLTNDESLVILCSYSGNTEETLSCLKEAAKRRCTIVGISSNGALLRECQLSNHEWIKIKEGIPPRVAFPNMFSAALDVLAAKGILKDQRKELSHFVNSLDVEKVKQMAQKIALELRGKVPVLYSSDYPGVLVRIKDEFNENAKIPAKWEVYPELDHNDIVGWGNRSFAKQFKIVHLMTDEEPAAMKARIAATKKLLDGQVEQIEVHMLRPSRLEKALITVLLFDLVSVYLAELYGTDAKPVEIVEELKQELKKR